MAAVLIEPLGRRRQRAELGATWASYGSCAPSGRAPHARWLLGRTGHWFAFQAQGLKPDVVTMAKASAIGMPVGACWARAELAAAFGPAVPSAVSPSAERLTPGGDGTGGRVRPRPLGACSVEEGLAGLPGVVSVRGAGLPPGRPAQPALGPREVSSGVVLGHDLLVNAVRPDAVRGGPAPGHRRRYRRRPGHPGRCHETGPG